MVYISDVFERGSIHYILPFPSHEPPLPFRLQVMTHYAGSSLANTKTRVLMGPFLTLNNSFRGIYNPGPAPLTPPGGRHTGGLS